MTWDRIAHMNAAHDRKPATGGKTYARAARRAPTPVKSSWERLTGITTARWNCGTELAQEDYLRTAFPKRYLNWEV